MPNKESPAQMGETETVSKKVCRDCGATYTSGSLGTAAHKKATGHTGGFKTVKETRPKEPMQISYNLSDPVGRALAARKESPAEMGARWAAEGVSIHEIDGVAMGVLSWADGEVALEAYYEARRAMEAQP